MTLTPVNILPGGERRGGIRSVAVSLPAGIDWATGSDGIQLQPVCAATMFRWGCESIGDTKPFTGVEPSLDFYSTVVGNQTICNSMWGALGPITKVIADEQHRRQRYREIAAILHDGEVGRLVPNPSLQSEAQTPAGGTTAAPLPCALQGLLDIAEECGRGDLVLHVPLSFMPHFLNQYLAEYDVEKGVYRFGEYLVSFDAYPNLGPSTVQVNNPGYDPLVDNVPAADGSEFWVYISTPPIIEVVDMPWDDTLGPQENKIVSTAESLALVAFDPCCTSAVLVAVCGP